MSVIDLFTGYDLHPIGGHHNAASLMWDAVDSHPTLETDPHTAKWPTRPTHDRGPEFIYPRIRDRCGDRCAFVDVYGDLVDVKCDQCSVMLREGE